MHIHSPVLNEELVGITASEIEQAEDFNGPFADVFNKSDHSEVQFLSRSAPKPNFFRQFHNTQNSLIFDKPFSKIHVLWSLDKII